MDHREKCTGEREESKAERSKVGREKNREEHRRRAKEKDRQKAKKTEACDHILLYGIAA